jgi:hypothetical protein
MKNSFHMKLNELYRELTKVGHDEISFVANVIYERYGKDRKKMLAGLYRLHTGNGFVPMDIRFAPYTFDVLNCTPTDGRSEKPFEMKPTDLMRY